MAIREVLGTAVFLALATRFSEEQSGQSAARGLLLVANKDDRTLSIIDPESGRTLAAVPEGGITGHEVAASPDGRFAYVPIYGNSVVGMPGMDGANVVVVDLAARKVSGTVDFGRGVRPHCAVFGPKDGLLYVTAELDNAIAAIDPHTLKVVGTVPTGQPESHMLAITRDGRRGYTANVGPGSVSVLDLEARKTVAIVPISGSTQRISLSADDRMAFTADQTKPQLAVIDTASNQVKQWVALPGLGYSTAATGDGRYLLVTVPRANRVAVVDLHAMEVVHSIEVPRAPQEVLISPDNRTAYVSCDASHQVAGIGIGDWKVKLIEAGSGADGLAWAPGGNYTL